MVPVGEPSKPYTAAVPDAGLLGVFDIGFAGLKIGGGVADLQLKIEQSQLLCFQN